VKSGQLGSLEALELAWPEERKRIERIELKI
jgi:hypothetical protein